MKKVIAGIVLALGVVFYSNAQDKLMKENVPMENSISTIALEQIPGEFTQKQLTVSEGTYIFEILNSNVGHNVGFVLVRKGEDISNPKNHIKTAYVTEQVVNGEKQFSNPTTLEKGEYVYFCPLNPTATDNTLTIN